jgi:putative glycerol-1-phosphate prenyltransferase
MNRILDKINQSYINKQKRFAVLIDPDKTNHTALERIIKLAVESNVDFFFVGGSLLTENKLDLCIRTIKQKSEIPVILFPGNNLQISKEADAILLLSLISGRNADLLIGNHVISAPYIKESKLEVIPTGYMLIDGGKPTTVSYISNTFPIPYDKEDIAACTAMAGEMLGLKTIYMDAGSGAIRPVSANMTKKIRNSVDLPIIVGGGIKTPEAAREIWDAGADIVVVGNAIEKSSELIKEIGKIKRI